MRNLIDINAVAMTLALSVMLLPGCQSEEPVATGDASSGDVATLTPSINEVEKAVSLDEEDRAVVAAALDQWQKTIAAPNDGPFRPHRAGMEFLATVAPSLDNEQLSDLVDYMRAYRDEHKDGLKATRDEWHGGESRHAKMIESLTLTDEQQTAMKTLRAEHRAEMEKLHDGFRDGTIEPDQMHEAATKLREAHREKLADILTAEQLSRLDARRAERHTKMIDRHLEHMDEAIDTHVEWITAILGLNAEQQSAVRTALQETAAERKQAIEAARDNDSHVKAFGGLRASHEAVLAALEKTLTPEQSERLEIVRRLHPGQPHEN